MLKIRIQEKKNKNNMDINLTTLNIEDILHYLKNKFPSKLIFENFVRSMELITTFENERKECVISRLTPYSNLKDFLNLIKKGNIYRIDYESSHYYQRQLKNVINFNGSISKRNITIDLDITDYRKIVTICNCINNNNAIKFCKTCHNLLKFSVLIIVKYLEYLGIYDYVVLFSGSKGYHIKILQNELTFDPFIKKGILCTFDLFSKTEDLKIRDCFQKKVFESDSTFEYLTGFCDTLMYDHDNCIDFFVESNLIILFNCIIFKEEKKIDRESFVGELKSKFIDKFSDSNVTDNDKMDSGNDSDDSDDNSNEENESFNNTEDSYGDECLYYFHDCMDMLKDIKEINYNETLRRIIITFYFPKIDIAVLSVENHPTRVPYTINKSGHISSIITMEDIVKYDDYYKIVENTNIFNILGGIDNDIFLKNFSFLENKLKIFDFLRNNFFIFKKDKRNDFLDKENIEKISVYNNNNNNNNNDNYSNDIDRNIYKKELILKFLFKYYKKKKLLNNFQERNKIEHLVYSVYYLEKKQK